MEKVFLETTAVANLFYKAETHRKSLLDSIPKGSSLVTSQYVIYELSRGFLRYLILIYNKTTLLTKFSELCRYGNSLRRKSYFQGALWEAFERYYVEAKFDKPDHMSLDEYQLAAFRAFLRRSIRRGWLKQQRTTFQIIDEVNCRKPIPAPDIGENGQYEQPLKKELCGKVRNCGLKNYMAKHRADFENLRTALQAASATDEETKRRIRSLRELYRVPKSDFEKSDCYSCGDAIICHEVPDQIPIVSTNQKHYEVICTAFKKTLLPLKSNSPTHNTAV